MYVLGACRWQRKYTTQTNILCSFFFAHQFSPSFWYWCNCHYCWSHVFYEHIWCNYKINSIDKFSHIFQTRNNECQKFQAIHSNPNKQTIEIGTERNGNESVENQMETKMAHRIGKIEQNGEKNKWKNFISLKFVFVFCSIAFKLWNSIERTYRKNFCTLMGFLCHYLH